MSNLSLDSQTSSINTFKDCLSVAYEVYEEAWTKPLTGFIEGSAVSVLDRNWVATIALTTLNQLATGKSYALNEGLNFTLINPFYKEIILRGVVQKLLLDTLPRAISTMGYDCHLTPKRRVQITTFLFAAYQVACLNTFTASACLTQFALTYYGEHYYGAMRESKLGFYGGIGHHVASNTINLVITNLASKFFSA